MKHISVFAPCVVPHSPLASIGAAQRGLLPPKVGAST